MEPPQIVETVLTLRDPSQPFYVEGYHKPSGTDPDEPAYDALGDILTRGHTSRLYRTLVRDKKLAVRCRAARASGREISQPVARARRARPRHRERHGRDAMRDEVEKLKKEDVTDEELQRFKTRAKADLLRSLNSNTGLAEQFALYQTLFGDWRELFRYVERVDKVTKADVKRVAGRSSNPIARWRASRPARLRAEARPPGGEAMTPRTARLQRCCLAAAARFVGAPADRPAQVAKPSDLKYPRLPDFTVPKPTRFVLPNGMVVLVMEDHELPLVNVVARIRTGTLLDPADKAGLGRSPANDSRRRHHDGRPTNSTSSSKGGPRRSARASAAIPARRR